MIELLTQLPTWTGVPTAALPVIGIAAAALALLLARLHERRSGAGFNPVAPLLVVLAFAGALGVGWSTPQAMIGDEVTHYYMAVHQAEYLPVPTYATAIPVEDGKLDRRLYAHANGWHYGAAIIHKFTGGSFRAVQLYHALFWLQFLLAGWFLARARGGDRTGASVLFVAVLASLPVALIFSVAFYQDVPVSAQILTAFYFLDRRRWTLSSLFMAAALLMKDTAVLFLPVWFILLLLRTRAEGRRHQLGALARSIAVIGLTMALLYTALYHGAGARYYPVHIARKMIEQFCPALLPAPPATRPAPPVDHPPAPEKATRFSTKVISNHPGSLRNPVNYVVYGGGLLWLVTGLGVVSLVLRRRPAHDANAPVESAPPPTAWLWWTGAFHTAGAAAMCWENPDVRFFLPGLPFLILPLVERVAVLRGRRIVLTFVLAAALAQGACVLAKTAGLRRVSPGLRAAIAYLDQHRPNPPKILMYPEGNFRLFPVRHEWYLGYRLRDFWRGDNDARLAMLREFDIGAIVVKKHLVAPADATFSNLGIYPASVVRELRADPRFSKLFENDAVLILAVPPQ